MMKAIFAREVQPGDRILVKEYDQAFAVQRAVLVTSSPISVLLTAEDGSSVTMYASQIVCLLQRPWRDVETWAGMLTDVCVAGDALSADRKAKAGFTPDGDTEKLLTRLREALHTYELGR